MAGFFKCIPIQMMNKNNLLSNLPFQPKNH